MLLESSISFRKVTTAVTATFQRCDLAWQIPGVASIRLDFVGPVGLGFGEVLILAPTDWRNIP